MMTYQYKTLGLAAAMALGAVFAFSPMKAEAAVIYASSIEQITDGLRGTANDRANEENALGNDLGTFFELGFGGVFEFQFGDPTGQKFFSPGSIVEITNGSADAWPEAVMIEVGTKGNEDSFITAAESFTNSQAGTPKTFTFGGGPFDTLRLTDITLDIFGDDARSVDGTGGFDVAAIGVTPAPIPLPASALLLLGGLGGLGGLSALRRRKRTA